MKIPGGVLLCVFTAVLCRQVVPLYSWLANGQPVKSEPRRFRQRGPPLGPLTSLKEFDRGTHKKSLPPPPTAILLRSLFKVYKRRARFIQLTRTRGKRADNNAPGLAK